jgi:hypothetical protein
MVTQAFAAFLVPPQNVVTASPASALLPASPISRNAFPLAGVPFDASSPQPPTVAYLWYDTNAGEVLPDGVFVDRYLIPIFTTNEDPAAWSTGGIWPPYPPRPYPILHPYSSGTFQMTAWSLIRVAKAHQKIQGLAWGPSPRRRQELHNQHAAWCDPTDQRHGRLHAGVLVDRRGTDLQHRSGARAPHVPDDRRCAWSGQRHAAHEEYLAVYRQDALGSL